MSGDEVKTDKKKEGGLFSKLNGIFKDKKKLEIGAACLLIVVILAIYFSSFDSLFKGTESEKSNTQISSTDYCQALEDKLINSLSNIKGIGKVSAVINFATGVESVIAYVENSSTNTTTDASGNIVENKTESKTPQIINSGGVQSALILKQIYPIVKGVLVTAEGASDARVKVEIINAVSTLLAVSPELIYVIAVKK